MQDPEKAMDRVADAIFLKVRECFIYHIRAVCSLP